MIRIDEAIKYKNKRARMLIQKVCNMFYYAEYENGSMVYPVDNLFSTEDRWQSPDLVRALFKHIGDYNINGNAIELCDIIKSKDIPLTTLSNIGAVITLHTPDHNFGHCGVVIDEGIMYYTIIHIVKNVLCIMKLNKFTMVDKHTGIRYGYKDMVSVDWAVIEKDTQLLKDLEERSNKFK